MNIQLVKVKEDERHIIKNLYSFYLHDLSKYSPGLKANEEGTFEFDSFQLIWAREGFHPIFIKADGELAGFILLLSAPFLTKIDYCINDFFLFNQFRGKGIGEAAIQELFQKCKGKYYVEQIKENHRAVGFWKKIYKENQLPFEEVLEIHEGQECVAQYFEVEKEVAKR